MPASGRDVIMSTCSLNALFVRTRRHLIVIALAASLSGLGCGTEIFPVPLACPECLDTAESSCSYFELDDGTRIRSQYTPGDPTLPLVIGVAGFGGTYTDVSIVFPKGTFSTISFSLPGGLCSDLLPAGTTHTIAKCTDVLDKLIEHDQGLIDQFGRNNVLVAGASFGALVVEDYFVRHPESEFNAVIVAGQDTPVTGATVDLIEGYLQFVDFFFPLADNHHLREYLASGRAFDVSQEIVNTQNRWLVIGLTEDDLAAGTKAMAERLGERARYAEVPGNHFMILFDGDQIRQLVMDNLPFLLRQE